MFKKHAELSSLDFHGGKDLSVVWKYLKKVSAVTTSRKDPEERYKFNEELR